MAYAKKPKPGHATRTFVLGCPCPKCDANPGDPCKRVNGMQRKALHAERQQFANRASLIKPLIAKRKKTAADYAWPAMRARVFAAKGNKCVYCGSDAAHVDHQLPRSRGGKDDFDNLVPSCGPCNISKGTMTAEEYMAVRR